jgi:hypothetical protein
LSVAELEGTSLPAQELAAATSQPNIPLPETTPSDQKTGPEPSQSHENVQDSVPLEAKIKSAVKESLDEAMHTWKEREKRKRNLFIVGIDEGRGNDRRKLERLFINMSVGSFAIEKFHRVGRKIEGKTRPLLVQMGSVQQKSFVLKRAPMLAHSERARHVFVRPDMDGERMEKWKNARMQNRDCPKKGSVPATERPGIHSDWRKP